MATATFDTLVDDLLANINVVLVHLTSARGRIKPFKDEGIDIITGKRKIAVASRENDIAIPIFRASTII